LEHPSPIFPRQNSSSASLTDNASNFVSASSNACTASSTLFSLLSVEISSLESLLASLPFIPLFTMLEFLSSNEYRNGYVLTLQEVLDHLKENNDHFNITDENLKHSFDEALDKEYPYLIAAILTQKKRHIKNFFQAKEQRFLQLRYKSDHPYFKIFFSEWDQYKDKTCSQIIESLEDEFTINQVKKVFSENSHSNTNTLQTLKEKVLKRFRTFHTPSASKTYEESIIFSNYFWLTGQCIDPINHTIRNAESSLLITTLLFAIINRLTKWYQWKKAEKRIIHFQEKTAASGYCEDVFLKRHLLEEFFISEVYKRQKQQIPYHQVSEAEAKIIDSEINRILDNVKNNQFPPLIDTPHLKFLFLLSEKENSINKVSSFKYFQLFFPVLMSHTSEMLSLSGVAAIIAIILKSTVAIAAMTSWPVLAALVGIGLTIGIIFSIKKYLDQKQGNQYFLTHLKKHGKDLEKLKQLEFICDQLNRMLITTGITPLPILPPGDESAFRELSTKPRCAFIQWTITAYRAVIDFMCGCSLSRGALIALWLGATVGAVASALGFPPILALAIVAMISMGLLFAIIKYDNRVSEKKDQLTMDLLQKPSLKRQIEIAEKNKDIYLKQLRWFKPNDADTEDIEAFDLKKSCS
jgi:hypothetical protein